MFTRDVVDLCKREERPQRLLHTARWFSDGGYPPREPLFRLNLAQEARSVHRKQVMIEEALCSRDGVTLDMF